MAPPHCPAMHAIPTPLLASRAVPRRLFYLFISLAMAGGLAAQKVATTLSATQLKRMSVEELLEQEVVSVSRRGETLGAAAGNIFYISAGADLGSGATALPELLRLAPSLFVAQSS